MPAASPLVPLQSIDRSTRRLLPRLRRWLRSDDLLVALLGVGVGALTGLAAIGFRMLIAALQALAWGSGEDRFAAAVAVLPPWQVVLTPALGGLLVALLVRFVIGGHRPPGVPQVLEATLYGGGRLRLLPGCATALAAALSLGAGASLGREGPVVHLGATLSGWTARRLRLPPPMARMLLACGVASAVAASFNAPLSGTVFALEVVVGSLRFSALAPVLMAALTGTAVARLSFGGDPVFPVPAHAVGPMAELPAFAALGVVAALVALAFMRSAFLCEDGFAAAARRWGWPPWLNPVPGGLAIGALALAVPQILGVGYEATHDALLGATPAAALLLLAVAKLAAVAVSFGAGFGGGVFSPSLVLGATAGGAFAAVAVPLVGPLASPAGVYALVGMAAVAAPVLGAPISTILMAFELTGDGAMVPGVMTGVAVSTGVVRWLYGQSMFTAQMARAAARRRATSAAAPTTAPS